MIEKTSRRKRWGKVLGGLAPVMAVVTGFGGWWVVTQIFPYAVVGTNRLERTLRYRGVTPEALGLRADVIALEAEPGVNLKGWFIRAENDPKGTVVLLHGHNSCKEAELRLAKLLAAHGFNSLAYDSRGCGESGGKFCTYGFYEKRDCSRYVDQLLQRFGNAVVGPVSIYGNSFGGAVALQTMAEDRRFRCGIVESTFATLREVVRDYEMNMTGVRLDALTDVALERGGRLAHFFPDAVLQPEGAARSITCPVMVVHGTSDTDIACRYGERIFRNLKVDGREWYPISRRGPRKPLGHRWRGLREGIPGISRSTLEPVK